VHEEVMLFGFLKCSEMLKFVI